MQETPIGLFEKELGSGLFPSQPGRSATFWRDGRNVSFFNEHLSTSMGQFLMFQSEVQEQITGVRSTFANGVATVFYGTPTALKKWDASNGVEDLTRAAGAYTGTINTPWQFARWGTWMVATNNTDVVQVYKNSGDFLALGGTFFTTAKLLYALDTHLIALNLNTGGNILAWTDLDDIEDWTAIETNQAGSKPMRNLDSDIVSVEKLNDTIMVYTLNEMFAVDFIGAPNVFGTRFLLEGFGPVGANAVAVNGGKHVGFGRQGIWQTDGFNFDYFDNPALRKFLYEDDATRYDPDKPELVNAVRRTNRDTVGFHYATLDSSVPNLGVEINYRTGAWSILSGGITAVDDSYVFPYVIFGDHLGNIFQNSAQGVGGGSAEAVDLTNAEFEISTGVGFGGVGEGGVGGEDGAG